MKSTYQLILIFMYILHKHTNKNDDITIDFIYHHCCFCVFAIIIIVPCDQPIFTVLWKSICPLFDFLGFFFCFFLFDLFCFRSFHPMKYRFYIFTFIKEKWYPNQPDITWQSNCPLLLNHELTDSLCACPGLTAGRPALQRNLKNRSCLTR